MSTAENTASQVRDVIIVGSGPAGYTAAVYTARANLKPLLLAGSVTAGGELMNTTDVENYPGFPEGIMGPDLMENFEKQAARFGTEIQFEDVTALDLDGDIKTVTIATGRPSRPAPLSCPPDRPIANSAFRMRSDCRATALAGVQPAMVSFSRTRTLPLSAVETPPWKRHCSSLSSPSPSR